MTTISCSHVSALFPFLEALSMNKKTKKRLDVVRKTLQKLRLQLSGAKQQTDEPDEVERLESEIVALQQEAEQLKNS